MPISGTIILEKEAAIANIFENPLILDNVVYIKLKGGFGSYLKLPVLTTTQRAALSASNGTFIFNSTTNQVEAYANGSWDGWTKGINWQNSWTTATAYAVNDGVENDGSAYICTAVHTSDSSTEPGVGASWASYWDLMAEIGRAHV